MLTSLSTALSGLTADGIGFDVIGNNLANLSTTGFKSSNVAFDDLMSQSMNAGLQVGLGVGAPTTERDFTQGSLTATGGSFDAAIQGSGFFVVRDTSNQLLYTRAGNFQLDSEGTLTTASGQAVEGWMATNGAVNAVGPVGNITVPINASAPPSATTQMSIDANLDATATVGDTSATWSTPIQVYDSLGTTHTLTMTFTKTAANSWSYTVSLPGDDVTAGTAGTPYAIPNATGTLTFDTQGQLTSPAAPPPATNGVVPISIPGLADGAADLNVNWSLYTSSGTSHITQFASASASAGTDADGATTGEITGVGISNGGNVTVKYSNGQDKVVAQIALATIRNPESLIATGQNNLQAGPDTAAASIGAANSGDRGGIVGGSLEGSNVDMATEFTNLIVLQRGYEANAKVITASEQMLTDTINLKQ